MLGCPDCERKDRQIAAQRVMLERQAREWERMMAEKSAEQQRRSEVGRRNIEKRWGKRSDSTL